MPVLCLYMYINFKISTHRVHQHNPETPKVYLVQHVLNSRRSNLNCSTSSATKNAECKRVNNKHDFQDVHVIEPKFLRRTAMRWLQFYIQLVMDSFVHELVYKPHFGTWLLLFEPFGQLRAARKKKTTYRIHTLDIPHRATYV